MARGDNNKDDKTKTLAIPILLDISKTFLRCKFCLVRSKYSYWAGRKRAGEYKDLCVLGNKCLEVRARAIRIILSCDVAAEERQRGCDRLRSSRKSIGFLGFTAVCSRSQPSFLGSGYRASHQIGRYNPNVLRPPPLRTNTSPPCICAIALTMASPSPWLPPLL